MQFTETQRTHCEGGGGVYPDVESGNWGRGSYNFIYLFMYVSNIAIK